MDTAVKDRPQQTRQIIKGFVRREEAPLCNPAVIMTTSALNLLWWRPINEPCATEETIVAVSCNVHKEELQSDPLNVNKIPPTAHSIKMAFNNKAFVTIECVVVKTPTIITTIIIIILTILVQLMVLLGAANSVTTMVFVKMHNALMVIVVITIIMESSKIYWAINVILAIYIPL